MWQLFVIYSSVYVGMGLRSSDFSITLNINHACEQGKKNGA